MNSPNWREMADSLHLSVQPFVDGRWIDSCSPERYTKINPATGEVLIEPPRGCAEDVHAAVRSARRAFDDGRWSEVSPQSRRKVLSRLADLFEQHGKELALLDCIDVGKPISQALGDVALSSSYLRFAAEACDKLTDDLLVSHPKVLALNVHEPVGVVGAILPWNFPMAVAAIKLAAALAAGNSLVLKPSELSPLSAMKIADLAGQAGLPPGVLNIVPGTGDTVGQALAEHPDVDMLTFTGSTRTGRALLAASGRSNLKKLLLECGGKSPTVVFADDLDLDVIAADVVQLITWNQGQLCVAGSRLLVESKIESELTDRIIARMAAIRPGDPLDPNTEFGPLVSEAQLARVRAFIDTATTAGATLRLGGRQLHRRGFYIEPTVFDHVRPDMQIAREEVFGPVLTVFGFHTLEEAVSLAHSVSYGLSARIWTRDLAKAYSLSRRLRVGEVTVASGQLQDLGVGPAAATEPFGHSGFGVEGGFAGLRQYTRRKAIHINFPHDAP
jgi:acyl-CoA reductase-like NAD-dependent aldehyde dehydrogenase